MKQYLELLELVLTKGKDKPDRTGTGTLAVSGAQARFDLSDGFPLLTTKKLHIKSIIYELLWFLKGDTNVRYLQNNGVTIWNEWADKNGDLGRVYGAQWRDWKSPSPHGIGLVRVDQIADVVQKIKKNPFDRRLIVTAWNPGELGQMALPPCHCLFQFFGYPDGTLDLQLYQRSCDLFLGVPFNIASYAMLLKMVAHVTGMKAGTFIHTYGDLHLYKNHLDQAREQLTRTPRKLPELDLSTRVDDIFGFDYNNFEFSGYDPYPTIKAPIAI